LALLNNFLSFEPRQIEKVAECVKMVPTHEDRQFRCKRAHVFGRVNAIDQRDGGNRHISNSARLWASHVQSRIKLGRLFALCAIGKPLLAIRISREIALVRSHRLQSGFMPPRHEGWLTPSASTCNLTGAAALPMFRPTRALRGTARGTH
jgi:hypothetical protein